MIAVIKGSSALGAAVRCFAVPQTPQPADPAAEERRALRMHAEALAAELDGVRAVNAAAIRGARDEGHAEGRRDGLAAAADREANRQAAFERAVAAESARFAEQLQATEVLAVALARAALGKVFARPEAMGEMVAATLVRHAATLQDQALLHVRVSGADFQDSARIESRTRDTGIRVAVTVDRDLPSGACRVTGRLGGIDLDIPGQWAALAALLDDMPLGEVAGR